MISNDFAKTKLIFDLTNYITAKRNSLLEDLVAYTEDPVRFKRRLRLLIQLSEYEKSMLGKISEFNTEESSDIYHSSIIQEFKREIDTMASINT